MNPIKKKKIQRTLKQTKERRSSMTCKVIECKVISNSLSNSVKEQLNQLFLESKWLYNSILASDDICQLPLPKGRGLLFKGIATPCQL